MFSAPGALLAPIRYRPTSARLLMRPSPARRHAAHVAADGATATCHNIIAATIFIVPAVATSVTPRTIRRRACATTRHAATPAFSPVASCYKSLLPDAD